MINSKNRIYLFLIIFVKKKIIKDHRMAKFNYHKKHKIRNRVIRIILQRIQMLSKKNSQLSPINVKLN